MADQSHTFKQKKLRTMHHKVLLPNQIACIFLLTNQIISMFNQIIYLEPQGLNILYYLIKFYLFSDQIEISETLSSPVSDKEKRF